MNMLETLHEFRESMDASPLHWKDRVAQHFERARMHFPCLKHVDQFLVNNPFAFLGTTELRVAKLFHIADPSNVVRARLEPSGPWVVRATGRGFDAMIICSGPSLPQVAWAAHGRTQARPRVACLPSERLDGELVVLKGAEAWLKNNEWCEKQFVTMLPGQVA